MTQKCFVLLLSAILLVMLGCSAPEVSSSSLSQSTEIPVLVSSSNQMQEEEPVLIQASDMEEFGKLPDVLKVWENENMKSRNGYDVLINAFLSWACGKTAQICKMLNRPEKYEYYCERVEKLNGAINSVFFVQEKKLYKTYAEKEGYSQLANALCILCGACLDPYLQEVSEKVAYGDDAWVKNTLSMNIFRFDALLQASKEKYSEFILQEIDKIYGAMLQENATSFWETEKGAADFDGAGSLCHGWSAIPVYYYHLLGVIKAEE